MAAFVDYDELRGLAFVAENGRAETTATRLVELAPDIVKEIDRLRDKVHRRDNKLRKLRCSFNEHHMRMQIQRQSDALRRQGQYIEHLKAENRRLRDQLQTTGVS